MTEKNSKAFSLTPDIRFGNDQPFVLLGGMNVLEDEALPFEICAALKAITEELRIPFIFKASFDKANRTSLSSFRGPGMAKGLELLAAIKAEFDVPIVTDIHAPEQAEPVAQVADIVQIPAFLARQTDLVTAAARTGAVIHIKKPQFLSPGEMVHMVRKCVEAGNDRILLCERGTAFGYNNLVVDMLGMDLMKRIAPVTFDASHALQRPGGRGDSADGRRDQAFALARAGVALGLAGLFLEVHPDPANAKCDGPSTLPLSQARAYLGQMKALDDLVKALPADVDEGL